MQQLTLSKKIQQAGFSLVELMVAILIGLIILAGVIQVVVSSKATFLSQEDMSYIQENARYAIRTITSDVQNAGYWGCAGNNPNAALAAFVDSGDVDAETLFGLDAVSTVDPDTAGLFSGVTLWEPPVSDGGEPDHTPEFFFVRRAGGQIHSLNSHAGAQITLDTSAHGYEVGDYLTVVGEDCSAISVIRVASLPSGNAVSYSGVTCSNSIRPDENTGYDCSSPPPQKNYLRGATVMEYVARGYYIGESSVLDGQPALKRRTLKDGKAADEEIALGVEDMQILYGVLTDDGGVQGIRFYDHAGMTPATGAPDWSNVVALKISLVFRSQAQSLTGDLPTPLPQYLGNQYDDRYIRQTVTTTVQLKNRT